MTVHKVFDKAGRVIIKRWKKAETVFKDIRSLASAYRMKEDPIFFAREILNFQPFSYQEMLLTDPSKRICACMGRQSGKSTTIAAKAIHFTVTRKRKTIVIVSATLRQSMLMFDKIVSYINSSKLRKGVTYKSRTKITFENGSSIIALPCGNDGSTLRGFTASVIILDEAAFMPEEVITSVVMPMIATTNGYCWMISTPWDKNHIFYRVFNDPKWSCYRHPSSINPLIDPALLEEQRTLLGEERYTTEYLAQFVDDSNSYFPVSLIRQCISDSHTAMEGQLFAGYDPGGKQSYAAFVIVRRMDNRLHMLYKKAEMGKTYTQFNVEVAEIHKRQNFKLLVDQTGLGNPIVEHLRELDLLVEGLTLTDRVKEELLSNLKILMEQRKLVLPLDTELHNSLSAIEFERNRTGGYRFFKRSGTYDDVGYALALACFAAKKYGDDPVFIKV